MNRSIGLLRSLLIYYVNPLSAYRMRRFMRPLIQPGDLCFDIGAHVGNRIRLWRALGAKVVALEPQPHCMQFLRHWYGNDVQVTLLEQAAGAVEGEQTLYLSEQNPTVSTLSTSWIDAVRQVDSFADVRWESSVVVKVTTLDSLIDQYGVPAYCKIDVEGFELEVVRGLSQPIRLLSFEYIPAAVEIAQGCIDRLTQLGTYEYNWSIGEQHRWQSDKWISAEAMTGWLDTLGGDTPSGDIYARTTG